MGEVSTVSTGLFISVFVALCVIGVVIATLIQRSRGPLILSCDEETYLVRNPDGRIQAMAPDMKIRSEDPRILKLQRRQQLRFPIYDPRFNSLVYDDLVTESGAISLRIFTTAPFPFTTVTNDGHEVTVTASVSFCVNRDRVTDLARLGDFGDHFERRIQAAFSRAIGRRQDAQLRESHHEIEREVTEEIASLETAGSTPGVALGVSVFDACFSYRAGSTLPSDVIMASRPMVSDEAGPSQDKTGAATWRLALAPVAAPTDLSAPGTETPGTMQLLGTDLDKLLDQLRERSPEQIATLLRLMEMQTRQNIVSILARSGGLVVYSARELGLEGNAALAERLQETASQIEDTPETE